MARIKIKDLPEDLKISKSELKSILGGVTAVPTASDEIQEIKGFFQGWQEKANQVDQQLTSILRIMKDLDRVGVGGSDLGAS